MGRKFLLLIALLLPLALSGENITVNFPNLTLKPGETGKMTVSYETDYNDYGGFQIEFSLPDGIHLTNAQSTDAFSQAVPNLIFNYNIDTNGKAFIVGYIDTSSGQNINAFPTGKQDFLELTFQADQGAEKRTYEIETSNLLFIILNSSNDVQPEKPTFNISVVSLCPDDNHPHMIDLGLPSGTKWACCNVDTEHPENQNPTNYGGYYAWGETEEKTAYDWGTYIHCDGSEETCHDIGSDITGTEYDVAHVKWGSDWWMPTWSQFQELVWNTPRINTVLNGINGFLFTGNNGNSVFFPASGKHAPSNSPQTIWDIDTYGHYWSGTVDTENHKAISLGLVKDQYYWFTTLRWWGFTVRPISMDLVPLQLSRNTITFIGGNEITVEITSGNGSYTVASSDENVATATIEGSSVKITAIAVGTATITVTDKYSKETATIEVTVSTPSVSLCPDGNHPHMIDLGLPSGTKWACCNVGATTPEGYGGYYAWGETETKTKYDLSTYTYCDGAYDTFHDLGSDISGTQYDVAHVKWGGSWVMPSYNQQGELEGKCSYEWTTINSINGWLFTGPSGGRIFLPASGYYWDDGPSGIGDYGYYRSSTQSPSNTNYAYDLYFGSLSINCADNYPRFMGYTVRPVFSEKTIAPLLLSENTAEITEGENTTIEITSGNGNYTVASSNENVATATISGSSVTITAVGAGTATITITDRQTKESANIAVTVNAIVYPPLALSGNTVSMSVGNADEVVRLTGGSGTYTVTSSNQNVVTATFQGLEDGGNITIHAVATGAATITVTDTRSGETATIEVTVTAPSVSLCPDNNHPHMIDLGLPSGTKWACCNVDTEHPENQSPTNYGGFYAWGETEVSGFYDWSTYSLCDGSSGNCQDIGSDIAGTVYDVAHAKWGGSWVMPSYEQFLELLDHSTYEWTTLNGVSGQKITATNGSSIFLPAAGQNSWGFPNEVGDDGIYWLSTHDPSHSYKAHSIYFYSGSIEREVYSERPCGLSVRPVAIESSVTPLQLSESSVAITVGENTTIDITSGNGSYTVASSNENIATATISGSSVTITAVAAGTATITVTDTQSGETATIEVTVDNPPTPFSLSEESLTLTIGEIAIVYPNNGNGSYTCESSDNRVATIIYTDEEYPGGPLSLDYFFRITAVGAGTATLTVTDTQSGETATIEVTVISVAPPMPTSPSPSDEATDVAKRGTFSWTTIPDDEESTLRYELFLDTDSSSVYSNSEVYMIGQGNTCRFSGLEPNTKYYWKVIVFNESGRHTTSDIWSFTTRESVPSSSSIKGDVNGDRSVTVADVMMMVNYVLEKPANQFLVKNADINADGNVNVTDIMKTIKIIMSGQGINKVELPQGADINFSELTVLNDGEQVTVDNTGTFGASDGNMMAFNGDSLVYISYGSQDDCRTLNSQETAISLLLPLIPYAVTDMDDDSFWLLKQMIGHLEQTRELAAAIDQSIIDKGYLDMAAVNPQYVAAASEVHRRLGFDDSEPAHSRMRKVKKTTYPIFLYGNKEAYGDGIYIIKDHTVWGTGKDGDCWKCEFTVLNEERWCYTSLVKARKTGDNTFNQLNPGISDTFTNLIKPMNVSAFMDWGIFSDLAINPKDWLTSLTDLDYDRAVNQFWEPLKNLRHMLKGEETDITTYDKVKKSGIKFEFYPGNEHLMVMGPGINNALMTFNIVKIVACPFLKMFIKELKKTDEYDNSDAWEKLCIYFTEWMCKDATFVADHIIAKVTDSSLSLNDRYLKPLEDIIGKFSEFCFDDTVLDNVSELIFKFGFRKLPFWQPGYDDPQVKALFKAYKSVLMGGDIVLFLLDSLYGGAAFEMAYGPSYEDFHNTEKEDFTVGDVTFSMVKLPGGPFMMGAEPDDKDAAKLEKPLHYVNLNKFAIGETEVTQDLWIAVMGANNNPSTFNNFTENRPVNNVSWNDCQQFITKLNQLTKRHFRLPTEAEWEFAATGGMYKRGYPYAGGKNIDDLAWYSGHGSSCTHAVKTLDANEFGLYDMTGNVSEWCQDYYDENYYKNSLEDNPCNSTPSYMDERVSRGGGFQSDAKDSRVSNRVSNLPYERFENIGLRLAMDGYQLVLSTDMIYLSEGGVGKVDILSGSGNYTVESSNDAVATAVIDYSLAIKKVRITAVSSDVTTITITVRDTETGQTAKIQVKVNTGQTFTVNGVSFRMVPVVGDTFWMGAENGNSEANSDERPSHLVALGDYSIGETEVTQALWQAVMGENPSEYEMLGGDNPVENVSWNDCQKFLGKLQKITGKNFRLPTEAEWEFAATGGKKGIDSKYAGGNDINAVAWYTDNSQSYTHPVASKQANELGIFDMTGNVWEWCHDSYAENYYSTSPSNNPCNTAEVNNRVARGGSWADAALGCRLGFRGNGPADRHDGDTGLRLALSEEYDMPLRLSSNTQYLVVGNQGTVNITSGSGNYTLQNVNSAVATAEIENNAVKITAVSEGETTVIVRDTQTGLIAYVQVDVSLVSFTLSTNTLNLTLGSQGTVDVISGHGTYAAVSNVTSVAKVTVDGSKIIITAVGVGTATITVRDNLTQERLRIEVTVSDTPQAYLTCPDDHHPHLIDLGLPSGTKWACCNVDTDHPENQSPTNYGGYYAWGETESKSIFDWNTYIHCDGSRETCHDLGSDIAGTQYDVAHVKWGGSWMMPSISQLLELKYNCILEWTIKNGMRGIMLTGTNGGSIFMPAAGSYKDDGLKDYGSYGCFWSSSHDDEYTSDGISFYDSGVYLGVYNRRSGLNVRPVSTAFSVVHLQLSSNRETIPLDNKVRVEIVSGYGSYIVTTSDENVAIAEIEGQPRLYFSHYGRSVKITAVGSGTATITVTDTKTEETVTIDVTVNGESDLISYLSCPDEHHPHLINLGLPSGTKWACCNVGATTPEEFGGYYAWGEIEEKDYYDWSNYTHTDSHGEFGDLYCHDLGNDIADTQYDVAHVKWGGSWEMPSNEQIDELLSNCTTVSTTKNGVSGVLFTGPSGGCFFLPSERRNYWSSTPNESGKACCLSTRLPNSYSFIDFRYCGNNVRPVSTASSVAHLQLLSDKETIIIHYIKEARVKIVSGYGSYITESSDEAVATASITEDGYVLITAVGVGTATITVIDTWDNKTAIIAVTVKARLALCPDDHHPHMIDLGLPSGTKWACCNVGASTPEGYGGYYAWGETEEKDSYNLSTYKYYQDGSYVDLGNDIAGTQYDVAHVKWSGSWVMPSLDQQTELRENCSSEWTTVNNINGRIFTGSNGSCIFLPASGSLWFGDFGTYGRYWSSTGPSYSDSSYFLNFNSSYIVSDNYYRTYGSTVRPVSR